MTAISLPADFEAWAETQVRAGRARSVVELAEQALTTYRREQDVAAGRLHDMADVFAELDRHYAE